MAAPSTTARVTPSGVKLTDGYRSTMAFARAPNIGFWEMTVKPPGMDGGDKIDTTTMLNDQWRTSDARALVTLTDSTIRVAYDPNMYNDIREKLLNQPGSVTVHFPDGSTLDFYGFLGKFEPSELKEGEMPQVLA